MAGSRRTFLKRSALSALTLTSVSSDLFKLAKQMNTPDNYDVIIIGGSYSGLATAMALGRSMKNVLIIDAKKPCNRQTPRSHNFITQDGTAPLELARLARDQVLQYPTIHLLEDEAIQGQNAAGHFLLETASQKVYQAKRLVFATGIRDVLPPIKGLAYCWGISVLHCPYCHGYEVRGLRTGIIGHGAYGFEFSGLISNWTQDLTLFSNGPAQLSPDQALQLSRKNISVVEQPIAELRHVDGRVQQVQFDDGTMHPMEALYTHASFEQHCDIPMDLGCELNEDGYLLVDTLQQTTVDGIYACGDNTSRLRTVANAVSQGTTAGMMLNKELVLENFKI